MRTVRVLEWQILIKRLVQVKQSGLSCERLPLGSISAKIQYGRLLDFWCKIKKCWTKSGVETNRVAHSVTSWVNYCGNAFRLSYKRLTDGCFSIIRFGQFMSFRFYTCNSAETERILGFCFDEHPKSDCMWCESTFCQFHLEYLLKKVVENFPGYRFWVIQCVDAVWSFIQLTFFLLRSTFK